MQKSSLSRILSANVIESPFDAERFSLDWTRVKIGEVVHVTDTGAFYLIKNPQELDNEAGYLPIGVIPTTITGNAGTATALQTPRNINGVAFNGTADITVTADATTLTGATFSSSLLGGDKTWTGSHRFQVGGGTATGSIIVGADNTGTTLTNGANKSATISVPHFTNAEETVRIIGITITAATSSLNIGGGSSSFNAATQIDFYTAATSTTVGGTRAGGFTSTGFDVVGTAGIGVVASNSTALNLVASTTAISSLRIQHGSAPTSPVNGDMWTTTAGLFIRINGATVGPLT